MLVNRTRGAVTFATLTRSNAVLWWVVAATAAILAGVILFRPARDLFHFGPLHADDLAVALGSGIVILVLLGLTKKMVRPSLTSSAWEARTVSS